MLMKRKPLLIIIIFPCLIFAASQKSSISGELYIPNQVINKILDPKNHFEHSQYKPKDSIQAMFENKNRDTEIHFAPLDFNIEVIVIDKVTMEWFPLYDFSRSSDIEEYEYDIKMKVPGACNIRLLRIKFPFF
jgi:hypothetical protein